jgi:hypothetical protein
MNQRIKKDKELFRLKKEKREIEKELLHFLSFFCAASKLRGL